MIVKALICIVSFSSKLNKLFLNKIKRFILKNGIQYTQNVFGILGDEIVCKKNGLRKPQSNLFKCVVCEAWCHMLNMEQGGPKVLKLNMGTLL
jgi:hypothetical protein